MRFPGFVGPTYQTPSTLHSAERCVNLYPELDESGFAKNKFAFIGTPGGQEFVTLANSPIRALWAGEGRLFVVAGTKWGELLTGGTFEDRGTIATDGRTAYVFANGTQQLIISGGKAYVDNGGAATGSNAVDINVADADAPANVAWGTYLDGYFIVLKQGSNDVYISALLNGLSWDALDFQSRIGGVDRLVAVVAFDGNLWLIGKRTIEIWAHTGAADFPFERISGATINQGCVAPESIQILDNSLFFVGMDDRGAAAVWRTRGFQLERVSNHGVESEITNWLSNAMSAWTYEHRGHRFYVLNNTITLVYDTATKMWHERGVWAGAGNPFVWSVDIPRSHAFMEVPFGGFNNAHFVGSGTTAGAHAGKVFVLNENVGDWDGSDAIIRYRQFPHFSQEQKWMFHHALQVDMEFGNWSGTPQAFLKWSNNGATPTATEKAATLVANNQNQRLIWRRLGRARDRVYGLRLAANGARVVIIDAFLELTPGTS